MKETRFKRCLITVSSLATLLSSAALTTTISPASASTVRPLLICQPGGTCGTKQYFVAGDSCEGYPIGEVIVGADGGPLVCVWEAVGPGKGVLIWKLWEEVYS
ncbi:MAG: hypothetical protein M0Z45_01560 [Actinomycetota bacterium]|nr:hypothetical protein [Actinomycetota bacterium]